MSLADELLADLEDDNDNEELEEQIKVKVESDDDGKRKICKISKTFRNNSQIICWLIDLLSNLLIICLLCRKTRT